MPGDFTDDSHLVSRCLKGDQQAYRLLLERYRRPVYGIVRRMVRSDEEARDLAQEAFIRAFKNLASFDQERSFSNWLFRIATNLCIDQHRRRKIATVPLVQGGVDGEEERTWDVASDGASPAEEFSDAERSRKLAEMVGALPPLYRAVLVLRHMEDRSYEEIADILNVPLGTVKARIHRAHRLLKEKLVRRGFDWIPGE